MKKRLICSAAATLMCAAFALGGCGEKGHNFIETVVDPTCTESGYTIYTCADEGCGYSYRKTGAPALGHKYSDNFCVRCDTLDPNAPETEGLEFLPVYDENDGTKITAWTVSKGSAEITNYIKIPSSYKDEASSYHDVVGIIDNAFEDCASVKQAALPSSVKEIGDRAFANCTNLKHLDIPAKTVSIGNGAFENCSDAFVDITLPKSVNDIGFGAFKGCDKIKSITMQYIVGDLEKYTEIDEESGEIVQKERRVNTHFGYMFGAENYGENADNIPSSLEKITIEGSLGIPDNAFYGCSSLLDVSIPTTVREIGKSAFEDCSSLKSVVMPYIVGETEQYTEIDEASGEIVQKERRVNTHFGYIFGANNHNENADKVPSSLATVELIGSDNIADNAFYGCSVKNVKIGGTIVKIGESAFENCTSLCSVQFESAIIAIGGNAFKNCAEAFKNIVIPTSVTEIGNGAFAGCALTEHVEMPYVIKGDGTNRHFGYVFGGDGASAVPSSVRYVKIVGSFPIPDGAFKGCADITDADIGGKISSIGNEAFAGCVALERFVFGNDVTAIGGGAFKGCDALKRVEYGGSLAQYLSLALEDEYSSPIFNGAELYVRGKRIDILA